MFLLFVIPLRILRNNCMNQSPGSTGGSIVSEYRLENGSEDCFVLRLTSFN